MSALSDPGAQFIAVTPSDTVSYRNLRSLYIGGGGDVSIIGKDGGPAVTFAAVPAGFVLPVQASIVRATGTTATDIVAMF